MLAIAPCFSLAITLPFSRMKRFYVRIGSDAPQILTPAEIFPLIQQGRIVPTTKACEVGASAWSDISALLPQFFAPDAKPPGAEENGAMELMGKAGHFIAEHGGEVAGLAKVFTRRILSSNFISDEALPEERAALEKAEIPVRSPMAQNYAAWRRAILWISGILLSIAGVLGLIDEVPNLFNATYPPIIRVIAAGMILINIVAPVMIIIAAIRWTQLRRSRKRARLAWMVQFLGPLLLLLLPVKHLMEDRDIAALAVEAQWQIQKEALKKEIENTPAADKESARRRFGDIEAEFVKNRKAMEDTVLASKEFKDNIEKAKTQIALIMGMLALYTLGPRVLGLFPGVVRASLTLRTLVPESPVPGYVIALVEPFYMVFVSLLVVIAAQAGNSVVFVGCVTLFAATIILMKEVRKLCTPMDPASMNAHLKPLRKKVVLTSLIGIGIIASGLEEYWAKLDPLKIATAVGHLIGNIFLLTVIAADFFIALMKFSFEEDRKLDGSPLYADMARRFADLDQVRLTQISDEEPPPAPPAAPDGSPPPGSPV